MSSDIDLFSSLFIYDSSTGKITRRISSGRNKEGSEAGTIDRHGYRIIKIKKRFCLAHRIAWLLHYGEWPKGLIDHIDGDTLNNRISNLRDVDHVGNQKNRRLQRTNTSGVNGVVFHRRLGKWQSQGCRTINGKKTLVYLGQHHSLLDAVAARKSFDAKNGYSNRHGVREA